MKLNNHQWILIYQSNFDVPEWLAQQKFQECDWNKDGFITGTEFKCF